MRPDRRHCWPAILARKTKGKFQIINDSAEGRTTGFDANELNSCFYLNRRLSVHGELDHVFVMLGTNDVKNRYGPARSSDIMFNMNMIIDLFYNHQKGINLVLLLPPPIGSALEDDFYGAEKRVAKVCKRIRELCTDRHLSLIDTHSILTIGKDLEPDTIHLNGSGRQMVADVVYSYLLSLGCR